jgi:chaperonin cofactor prefoldin
MSRLALFEKRIITGNVVDLRISCDLQLKKKRKSKVRSKLKEINKLESSGESIGKNFEMNKKICIMFRSLKLKKSRKELNVKNENLKIHIQNKNNFHDGLLNRKLEEIENKIGSEFENERLNFESRSRENQFNWGKNLGSANIMQYLIYPSQDMKPTWKSTSIIKNDKWT